MSSSASRAGATGRLLTWAVAATVACGAVGLSGATSAHAATGSKVGAAHQQVHRPGGPWLDSAFVELDGVNGPGRVFAVTANNGVPWIYDPRDGVTQRWTSLRRVPGSQGGYVLNISVAAETDVPGGPVAPGTEQALLIKARTGAGIYQTRCVVQTGTDAAPTQVLFDTNPLANCPGGWTAITP